MGSFAQSLPHTKTTRTATASSRMDWAPSAAGLARLVANVGRVARIALCLALGSSLVAFPAAAMAYTSDQPTSQGNPMANKRWFVDWEWGLSQRQYLEYVTGRRFRPHEYEDRRRWARMAQADPYSLLQHVRPEDREKAQLMLKIARNPQTARYGHWTKRPGQEVRLYLRRLRRTDPGSYAFFYVYRLRHDGCARARDWSGRYNRGWTAEGGREGRRYRRWIRAFARALGQQPAAVFLEPDGLGAMDCVPRRFRGTRYGLLRYAIRQISRDRNAAIYLDAGASDWEPAGAMAYRLRRAGVGRVRGFFLNSTHYDWTQNNVRYGDRLSALLGGKHYVVSTAVNGRGPYRPTRRRRYFNEFRCNPPGRALGEEPTVRTASVWADAYLWIGDPGRSGSSKCPHPGMPRAPRAGAWWEWYALELARDASWQ
jgi:endoglucanase